MAQKQVTIVAGDVSDEAQEWLKQHGAKIEGFGLLTITLPEQAKVYHGSRGWDYSLSFYGADGNNEESYIDVELDLDAYETRLRLVYEGDRSCTCKGRGCPECVVELAAIARGENPYAHHTVKSEPDPRISPHFQGMMDSLLPGAEPRINDRRSYGEIVPACRPEETNWYEC